MPTSSSDSIQAAFDDNRSVIEQQTAILSNLALSNAITAVNLQNQNAVANQQALNELAIAVVGKTVNLISNLGPVEARSAVDVLSNNELAQTIADLKAALDSFAKNQTPVPAQPDTASQSSVGQG